MTWRPAARPSLGQGSSALIDQAARRIVEEAEPVARRILSEERTRAADAVKSGLPLAGVSAALALVATYLIPPGKTTLRASGYGASALALAGAGWMVLDGLSSADEPAPPQDRDSGVVGALADQVADSFVRQAEPRVRALVDEESARLSEAASGALPLAGMSAAAAIGTAYLVPEKKNALKALGYMTAAGLLLGAAWTFLDRETPAA